MEGYTKAPKTCGVSFKHWKDLTERLCREKKTKLKLDVSELSDLYHKDVPPEEVYYINRTRTIKHAVINITFQDEFGEETIVLTNNQATRRFYDLNPGVYRVMK